MFKYGVEDCYRGKVFENKGGHGTCTAMSLQTWNFTLPKRGSDSVTESRARFSWHDLYGNIVPLS
jgi:hypothetical protein